MRVRRIDLLVATALWGLTAPGLVLAADRRPGSHSETPAFDSYRFTFQGRDEADDGAPEADEPMIIDAAIPPPGVKREAEEAAPSTEGREAAQAVTNGAEHVEEMPAVPVPTNSAGSDIPRASLAQDPPGKSLRGMGTIQGRFTWSYDDEKRPIPIYLQYGFVTVVELRNGEKPTGGAMCGLCGPQGAFTVEALSDRIGIKPREMSTKERGVVATNLSIITDQGRTLTFDLVEVSGLNLARTDRHEVRSRAATDSPVVKATEQYRMTAATKAIEQRYATAYREAKKDLVPGAVTVNYVDYPDVEVEKSAGFRKALRISSCVTIGDTTVVRFTVPADLKTGSPMVAEETPSGIRPLRVKKLKQTTGTVSGRRVVSYVVATEAAKTDSGTRVVVSVPELRRGREMKSSAGRV